VFNDIGANFNDLAHKSKVENIHKSGRIINEFADGLSILSGNFAGYKERELTGYENFSNDDREDIKARDAKTRNIFMRS